MSTRSLNKVMLIGNLTRDPEIRYTGSGTAVATFGLATNRSWNDSDGQRQEDAEFHRIVAWSKLAEICEQLLFKGRKVFIEGRLQTRKWTGQDGQEREAIEIVAENMMVLDNRQRDGGTAPKESDWRGEESTITVADDSSGAAPVEELPAESEKPKKKAVKKAEEKPEEEAINVDDIPF